MRPRKPPESNEFSRQQLVEINSRLKRENSKMFDVGVLRKMPRTVLIAIIIELAHKLRQKEETIEIVRRMTKQRLEKCKDCPREDRRFDFLDDNVSLISEKKIKTVTN